MDKGITRITVQGFKSLYDETSIEIRPLTILAGANSSGKSSIMQPLLLMKQTLEAPSDIKSLWLDGENVYFNHWNDFLSAMSTSKTNRATPISFRVHVAYPEYEFRNVFSFAVQDINFNLSATVISSYRSLSPVQTSYKNFQAKREIKFEEGLTHEEIINQIPEADALRVALQEVSGGKNTLWRITPNRCFLQLAIDYDDGELAMDFGELNIKFFPIWELKNSLRGMIHVSGLRGKPQRVYNATPLNAVPTNGLFEEFVPRILNHWTKTEDSTLITLAEWLQKLKLTSHVGIEGRSDNPTEIGLLVGRILNSEIEDLVNIADVGFGVSQVLPVLVALLVAEPGQLVYIEQPELHLHPRAQVKLAEMLAEAANRGVRVVVETHSSLLIQGVQTLIAQQKLPHSNVVFHWFTRDENGHTHVASHIPDKLGTTGDLPEDFSEVELEAQNRYLEAVEKRELEQWNARKESEVSSD
jgi:hypothetical protein